MFFRSRNTIYIPFSRTINLSYRWNSSNRSPTEQYDWMVNQDKIKRDEHQRDIVTSLHYLHEQLLQYKPPPIDKLSAERGILSRLLGKSKLSANQPKGVYLWGDVGCGKTMLMDMFYATIPYHLTRRRIHFHSFMQEVHHRSHDIHQEHGDKIDATQLVAEEIAKNSNVLCFDEFQVIDVADAMILRRLFDMLYNNGVVTFMTSNRPPDNLYENGVQRQSFIPCIEQIKRMNKVIYLNSPTDYRKIDRPLSGVYYFPPTGKALKNVQIDANRHLDKWFEYFSQNRPISYDFDIQVWGRSIQIPKCVPEFVAQFSFQQLCGSARSAADYLEITKCFPAIIISDIPVLSLRQTDYVRRFITFLDAAYESHSKLAVTAERPFEHLFNADDLVSSSLTPDLNQTDMEDSDLLADGSTFSGAEEKFAFTRALSRLKQMSSQQWLDYIRM